MKICILFLVCLIWISCNTVSNYPISKPTASANDSRIAGKWKFEEDTNKNNFYLVESKQYRPNEYHTKFWDRGGTNPTYESNIFFSKI